MIIILMKIFTASAAIARFLDHQISVSEILNDSLSRIDTRESDVKAWIFLAAEAARQQMASQEQYCRAISPSDLLSQCPLFGIPVGVKDIFATVDMPTAWGLSPYRDRYLPEDAAVVTRLKAAGAIILGKTVTTELATAAAGPTRNPHNLAHTPGGSSSGSAAAVADGMVPIAIGSQTMGSVLRPAAYCGVFGFKPSWGLISRDGVMSVSAVLDHVGMFARCLNDIRRVFEVLIDQADTARQSPAVRSHQSSRPPQLAWIKTPHWHLVDPIAQTRLQQMVDVLSNAGANINAVELPTDCADFWETIQTLCAYGLYQHHGWLLKNHRPLCSPNLQAWLQRGQQVGVSTYTAALHQREQYRASIDTLFSDFDAVLTPVTSGPAPHGLENTGSPLFCGLWTMCGLPAINIPIGQTLDGLPLGCQLVGRYNCDRQLLHIAEYCWQHLKPIFGDIKIPGVADSEYELSF
jgi:Asp-tRNA(Asn)/Glu-tRNA(Gln) amidotransferase A subunit family amidase